MDLVRLATRHLFFTGKGGVGKTSVACATAVGLADAGKRVLLVSTDPASNLDEVLGASLGTRPTPFRASPASSRSTSIPRPRRSAYRERVVGPYRELLPPAAVRSMEEQLSGACTVEIAAFDEFARLLGDARRDRGVRPRPLRHRADRAHAAAAHPPLGLDRIRGAERVRDELPRAPRRPREAAGALRSHREGARRTRPAPRWCSCRAPSPPRSPRRRGRARSSRPSASVTSGSS